MSSQPTPHSQLSLHAQQRSQQRAIPNSFIQTAMHWGREEYLSTGVYRYFVGWRDLKMASRFGHCLRDVLGLVVICSAQDTVITAYWRRQGTGPRMAPYVRTNLRGVQ